MRYGFGTNDDGSHYDPKKIMTPLSSAGSYKPPHGGFPSGEDVVLDGPSHEDDLPRLDLDEDVFADVPTISPPGFVSDGGDYPDWTDDRLYRLADETEHFTELYRSAEFGSDEEIRQQLRVIYDLVVEDGR